MHEGTFIHIYCHLCSSQTTTNIHRYCGYLAGSRTFKCPHAECGVHVERDGNAARNIWLWAILEAITQIEKGDSSDNEDKDDGGKASPRKRRKLDVTQPVCTLSGVQDLIVLGKKS